MLAMPASAGVVNIANPGFEDGAASVVGATGWTITSGGTDWFTAPGTGSSTNDPIAAAVGGNWLSGNRLVTGAGSSNNPQTISQLIDISTDAEVASGSGFLNLEFQYSDSDQNDDGSVTVSFFSDVAGTTPVGTALATGTLTPTAPDGTANAPWEIGTLSGFVPASAQSLQIELEITRAAGSAGNVHFDAFSGTVTAVPEPTSLAVLGLGACGVVARRRKKAKA